MSPPPGQQQPGMVYPQGSTPGQPATKPATPATAPGDRTAHGKRTPPAREERPEPAEKPDRESTKGRLVRRHLDRARGQINSGSANAVVDRMKQAVAEKRASAAQPTQAARG